MSPFDFLALMLILTSAAAGTQAIRRKIHTGKLRRLARECRMHFSAADRFRLAPRIAPRLTVPGAAAVRVVDLIYGIEQNDYRYVFAAEYTTGVLRTKTDVRRVVGFREPRDGSRTGLPCELSFAATDLPLVEQYRQLLGKAEAEKK